MAREDSYEIMPYKEIVELKKQIAELQERTGDTSSKELLSSMAALTKSMNNMLQLFSSAAEEMKLEEKTESELSGKIGPLMEKVDKLEEQNKTIAEGLVAVADMVKEMKGEKRPRERPRPLPPRPKEKPVFEDFPPLEPKGMKSELPPSEPPKPTKPINQGPSFFSTQSPRVVVKRPMPPPGGPPPMPPPGAPYGGPPPMPPPGVPPPMPPLGAPHGGPPPMPPPGEEDLGPLLPLPPLEEPKKKKGFLGIFKKR